jgi:hypothetical protein
VHLAEHRLREASDRVELALRLLALAFGRARLADRHRDAADDRDRDGARGDDAYSMTADELPGPIPQRIGRREHGAAVEKALDVVRHPPGRAVTPLRLLAERLHDYHVHVGGDALRQRRPSRARRIGHLFADGTNQIDIA